MVDRGGIERPASLPIGKELEAELPSLIGGLMGGTGRKRAESKLERDHARLPRKEEMIKWAESGQDEVGPKAGRPSLVWPRAFDTCIE